MSGRRIPAIPTGKTPHEQAVKQALDYMSGQAQNSPELAQLPQGATTEQMRLMLNKIIQRLNGQ